MTIDPQTYTIGDYPNTTHCSEDQLRKNYSYVHETYDVLRDSARNIEHGATALLLLLRTGSWQKFRANDRRVYEYDYFGDFVVAPVSAGLATTQDRLRALARGDSECEVLLEAALKREGGGQPGNKNAAKEKTTFDNIQGRSPQAPAGNSNSRLEAPTGTSRAATLRAIARLARDASDPRAAEAQALLDRVYAREVSANAAAIQLGLRRKAMTFNLATLSEEVQQELQRLRDEEDWSTGEIIEEGLRALFRLVRDDDAPAADPPITPAAAPSPAPPSNGHRKTSRRAPAPRTREEIREAVLKLEKGQCISGRRVHALTGQEAHYGSFAQAISIRSECGEEVIVSGNGWRFRKKPRSEMDAEGLSVKSPSWEVLERGD